LNSLVIASRRARREREAAKMNRVFFSAFAAALGLVMTSSMKDEALGLREVVWMRPCVMSDAAARLTTSHAVFAGHAQEAWCLL
jgi:hypothetical protein